MPGKITIMTAILGLLLYALASAEDGWQADIKVTMMDAENRLSIGQRPDAADGWNARYDVPAILSGDIMAYIEEPEGGKFWRKFKSSCGGHTCTKSWDLLVESDLRGQIIKLNCFLFIFRSFWLSPILKGILRVLTGILNRADFPNTLKKKMMNTSELCYGILLPAMLHYGGILPTRIS